MATKAQCSLYVIASVRDGVPCSPIKVGIARDPNRRLADFRTASPDDLALSLNVVLESRDLAADAERACIDIAKRVGIHRRGEWLNLDPGTLGALIGCSLDAACTRASRGWRAYQAEIEAQSVLWTSLMKVA